MKGLLQRFHGKAGIGIQAQGWPAVFVGGWGASPQAYVRTYIPATGPIQDAVAFDPKQGLGLGSRAVTSAPKSLFWWGRSWGLAPPYGRGIAL